MKMGWRESVEDGSDGVGRAPMQVEQVRLNLSKWIDARDGWTTQPLLVTVCNLPGAVHASGTPFDQSRPFLPHFPPPDGIASLLLITEHPDPPLQSLTATVPQVNLDLAHHFQSCSGIRTDHLLLKC